MEISSEEDSEVHTDDDSDVELQKRFAKGELKPGLHALVPFIRKEHVNNINGIRKKLEDIKSDLEWVERLDLTNNPVPIGPGESALYGDVELKKNKKGKVIEAPEDDKVNNDFKREMTFYRQAIGAVREGLPRLKQLSVQTKRPEDYFAQMAKTDDHMKKIREKLLSKEQSIEKSEKAKKLRELRKYGKQIQREVLQKRQKEKKEMINQVKKYKKGQKGALDFLEDGKKGKKGGKKNSKVKTDYKDNKYGFGGQKKRSKYNTASSSADITNNFKTRNNSSRPKGSKGKKTKTRPGKARRQQMSNRKKR